MLYVAVERVTTPKGEVSSVDIEDIIRFLQQVAISTSMDELLSRTTQMNSSMADGTVVCPYMATRSMSKDRISL